MRHDCIKAVTAALGRDLNQGEAHEIEQRIVRNARALAQADPKAWMAKPKAQRLQEAGQRAALELIGEARLKAEREALTIAAHSRMDTFLADAAAQGVRGLDAIDRKVAFHADGKTNGLSIESQAKAIRNDLLRQLIPVMEASNPKWFGLLDNPEGMRAITMEIFGEDSGNPEAKAGAKIWHEVTGAARERFNAAGGDIGKLEDWGMPHHHSQSRVAHAAKSNDKDVNRDAWVSDVTPKLDRSKYINEDGSAMNTAQLTEFLQAAWLTIATGGANKLTPGQFKGNGARANRGSASRQIHFKDAQSYIDYQSKFGERSLYEVLTGHVEGVAKDIALVEEFGPNPDQTARYYRDQAVQADKIADPLNTGKADERAIKSENLYNVVAGRTQPVANEHLANGFDTLRNWLTASRLGGAVISSLTDEGTLHLTARLNNLPALRVVANELAALNPANKMEERMAMRAGLALNTFISTLNRFGQDQLGQTFSKKVATTVLRASGLNAITEARRRAFGVTQMGALGGVASDHATMGKMDPKDAAILKAKGVTDTDFGMWKAAQLEDWGNGNTTMLTPDSVYRIPDAKVDQVIGPKIAKLKADAAVAVADLKARDIEDAGWVNKRAQKLSAWLVKTQARVDARIAKAEGAAKAELQAASAKLSKLTETVEGARASWDTPQNSAKGGKAMLDAFGEDMPGSATGDIPGVNPREKVGFYGKGNLRRKGVDEGRAREGMRNVESQVREISRSLKATKVAELTELFDAFHERREELAEFTKDSQTRIAKRGQVADRLNREIEPAIARARIDAREKAVTRLLGMILEETDMAVIEPGAKERAFMGAGIQRGTWKGELARSFFLFKSFPLAMMTRHWSRAMAQPGSGRAKYLATLIATTTLLGAVSMQIKEMLSGRDPRNMNPFDGGKRNWLKAMLQGGSLGLYGDFLFSDSTQHGQSPVASFLGPVVGLGEDVFKLTQGNAMEFLSGKKTHIGAEAVKFVKGNLPGGNLWYTKAAMDHLIWNQLAEYMSPGYLSKVRRRAQSEFGQSYYWDPADLTPDRAPDLAAMGGEQ